MSRLVLLGLGHAHVQVLHGLAQSRPAGVDITVIAPQPYRLYSGMVPGFVAGHYTLDACVMNLQGLLARSGARYVASSAVAMDADAGAVTLANGDTLAYDWLSLNTGPVMDREKLEARIPGARAHGLFVRPIEAFGPLWSRLAERAGRQPLQLAVVGGGVAGLELAMAAAHALAAPVSRPGGRVTLVTGGTAPPAHQGAGVQRRVAAALRRLRVDVVPDTCVGMGAGQILLASGRQLACDAPLLAVGTQAPPWLAGSGLALDAAGFVAVNRCLQSTSHPGVFAAGDVASRVDAPARQARSGVYAVRAGPPLLANLRAALQARALKPYQPQQRTLSLISCGHRHAIASWGGLSWEGAWVWRWKDRIDRRFVATYGA
ncbi:MAG: hypothetical protein JWR68_1244 [Polaromonas sp.]|nr:hypothetical protein [Polaromonas sp.]